MLYSKYMLAFRNRFHGHGSLKYVYTHGKAIRSRLVTLKYTTHPKRKDQRIAVVVSKKVVKGAVGRNRIRRRIYEVVRHELLGIQPSKDLVLIVFSAELLTITHEELVGTIQQLFKDAGVYR